MRSKPFTTSRGIEISTMTTEQVSGRTLIARTMFLIISILVAFQISPICAAPVRIVADVVDAPGEGFNDSVLGPQRLRAFRVAADLWGGFFKSSFPGETVRVTVSFGALPGVRYGEGAPFSIVLPVSVPGTPPSTCLFLSPSLGTPQVSSSLHLWTSTVTSSSTKTRISFSDSAAIGAIGWIS